MPVRLIPFHKLWLEKQFDARGRRFLGSRGQLLRGLGDVQEVDLQQRAAAGANAYRIDHNADRPCRPDDHRVARIAQRAFNAWR